MGDEILETLDHLISLAEKKDLSAILGFLAEDFGDFEGRDKHGLGALLSSYFEGRTGIVVHRLGARVVGFEPDRAEVEAEVALSSGGAEALRRLVRISPDIYRLRLDFGRVGRTWLVRYAEWSPIGLDGLLPDSLGELKKIFPRLSTDK
jgi:hypothetical protein